MIAAMTCQVCGGSVIALRNGRTWCIGRKVHGLTHREGCFGYWHRGAPARPPA